MGLLLTVILTSLQCVCFLRDCLHCTCRGCEDDQKSASLLLPPLFSTSLLPPPLFSTFPPLQLLDLHRSSISPKRQSQTGFLPSHRIHLGFQHSPSISGSHSGSSTNMAIMKAHMDWMCKHWMLRGAFKTNFRLKLGFCPNWLDPPSPRKLGFLP